MKFVASNKRKFVDRPPSEACGWAVRNAEGLRRADPGAVIEELRGLAGEVERLTVRNSVLETQLKTIKDKNKQLEKKIQDLESKRVACNEVIGRQANEIEFLEANGLKIQKAFDFYKSNVHWYLDSTDLKTLSAQLYEFRDALLPFANAEYPDGLDGLCASDFAAAKKAVLAQYHEPVQRYLEQGVRLRQEVADLRAQLAQKREMPKTATEVREFIGERFLAAHYENGMDGLPSIFDKYSIDAEGLLFMFSNWVGVR